MRVNVLLLETPCPATLSVTTQKVNLITRVGFVFFKGSISKNVLLLYQWHFCLLGKCCVDFFSLYFEEVIPQMKR